jgi:hypothetical protein
MNAMAGPNIETAPRPSKGAPNLDVDPREDGILKFGGWTVGDVERLALRSLLYLAVLLSLTTVGSATAAVSNTSTVVLVVALAGLAASCRR